MNQTRLADGGPADKNPRKRELDAIATVAAPMIRAAHLLALAILALPLPGQKEPTPPPKDAPSSEQKPRPQRRSTRQRRQVQVLDGPRFQVPNEWLDWHRKFGDNLVTRPSKKLLDPKDAGEWDREYGTLLDTALPLRDCAFVGGGEAFGKEATGFSDLQMRLYVLEASPKEVEGLLDTKGAEGLRAALAPRRFPRNDDSPEAPDLDIDGRPRETKNLDRPPPIERFQPTRNKDQKGPWRRSRFVFDVWYHDYGGRATVDLRLRAFGKHTVVVAFCYVWEEQHAKSMQAILDSVAWPEKAPKAPARKRGR